MIGGSGLSLTPPAPMAAHHHTMEEVDGLDTVLGEMEQSRSNEESEIEALQTAVAGKAPLVHGHAISDVTSLQTALDGKAASSHTHTIANVTGLQTAIDGKAASSHTHTIANVTGLQTALDGKAATSHTHATADITGLAAAIAAGFAPTVSTPSRTLNSAGFQPSATKPVLAVYSVRITCTASLAGGQDGKVELMSDSNATPTTVRATAQNRNSVSLAIALTAVNEQTVVLSHLVPAGHYVRLISSQTQGSPSFNLVSQTEIAFG